MHLEHRKRVTPGSAPVLGHDANLAEWLDGGRSDQVFGRWGTVIEDSSLGLAVVDIEDPASAPPTGERPH